MSFQLQIPAQDVSDIFWRHLSLRWAALIRERRSPMDYESLMAERDREHAAYDTGSVPSTTAVALLILGAELKPQVAFEVGTFIGNSTRALAYTCKKVYTCDYSNDIKLACSNVTQYPMKSSTDALAEFSALGQKIGLMFLDGRLQPADRDHLKALTTPETVFALDDVYQLEKGTINVSMILETLRDRRPFYVPPPRGEPFAAFGVPGGTTLGLVVPAAALQIIQA